MAESDDRLERIFTEQQSKKMIAGYTVYSEKIREIIEEELERKITDASKGAALANINQKTNTVFVMTQNELNRVIPESYKFGLEWADKSAIDAINAMETADFTTKLEVNKEILRRKAASPDQALANKSVSVAIQENLVVQQRVTEAIGIGLEAKLKANVLNTAYGQLHQDAMQNLLSSSYTDFRKGLAGVQASASNVLSQAQAQQIRTSIAEKQLTKTSILEIKKRVLADMAEQGFTTIASRDGKRMPIDWYAEMLTRTEVIKTANEATINRAAELGINIVTFSEHLGSCEICIPYEGLLYDLTGVEYPYPPEPPLHPNCRHILILRPDLSI